MGAAGAKEQKQAISHRGFEVLLLCLGTSALGGGVTAVGVALHGRVDATVGVPAGVADDHAPPTHAHTKPLTCMGTVPWCTPP